MEGLYAWHQLLGLWPVRKCLLHWYFHLHALSSFQHCWCFRLHYCTISLPPWHYRKVAVRRRSGLSRPHNYIHRRDTSKYTPLLLLCKFRPILPMHIHLSLPHYSLPIRDPPPLPFSYPLAWHLSVICAHLSCLGLGTFRSTYPTQHLPTYLGAARARTLVASAIKLAHIFCPFTLPLLLQQPFFAKLSVVTRHFQA